MSPELAEKIKYYDISLDSYGANSFGNSVLGRYSFFYFLDKTPPVIYVFKKDELNNQK